MDVMTSPNIESASGSEICTQVKHLGYGASASVRLYGEEFEVMCDPFPDAGGIAVHARTKKDSRVRLVQIPATVLQSMRPRVPDAA
jgi:hypothetical protein